jgi:GNAT superfamily N-acetyltransferase
VAPQYRAKRGLTFQRERLIDLWDEVLPLLVEHKEEIAHYPDLALDVDYVTYEAQDAGGVMRAYTARLNGALVGYSAFFVRHNLHYKASLQAINDVLFVQAAHRHGRVGLQLIRFCEAELQREGVQVVFQHLKAASTQTCALFDRLGYETIDVIKGKRLDR